MPALPERDFPEEPHVWTPETRGDPDVPFDRFGHALLRDMRDRKPPRDRLRLGLALFIAIVLHIALLVLLRLEMRPRQVAPTGERENAIQVTFFEPPPAVATPAVPQIAPPPPLAAPPPPRVRVRVQPRNPNAMTATIGPPPALHVYGKNGQVLLPPPSSVAVTPDYKAPQPQEPSLMQHSTPLPYQSTRFNKDWAPSNESLGHKLYRRAADATTATKVVRLPGGMKVECGVSPLRLGLGCAPLPPPPPPKNDNDIRLSLPPPVTLTGKKVTVPAASSTATLPAKASTAPKPADASH